MIKRLDITLLEQCPDICPRTDIAVALRCLRTCMGKIDVITYKYVIIIFITRRNIYICITTDRATNHSRRGRDRTVVVNPSMQSVPIMSWNPANCEVYSIQHYVMKCVIDLRHVGGFLGVFRFPPPIKLIATI